MDALFSYCDGMHPHPGTAMATPCSASDPRVAITVKSPGSPQVSLVLLPAADARRLALALLEHLGPALP